MGHLARFALVAGLLVSLPAAAAAPPEWVTSWATSQQPAEPQNTLPAELHDTTLRQIVHLTLGGPRVRVRLSNVYGATPLHIAAAHIAKPVADSPGAIDPATDSPLTFSGRPDVTIPVGAEYLSDPATISVTALSDLAISLHIDALPPQQTGHPGSRATSYYATGDQVSAPTLTGGAKADHWYHIAAVEVQAAGAGAIVVLGDSITDGHGATTNANDRWPDNLARRLQASPATRNLAVLNAGIGGNRLLLDGLGPNALARFDRDVLAPPGVRYLIVLEGVNDLGTLTRLAPVPNADHAALVARITAAYEQIVARAHPRGIKVYGATILPYAGSAYYHPDALNEADRQAVNTWIRAPGHFDAVIDFDKVMRDPGQPDRMLPAYDSGDFIHPGPAGYRAMADAIPLSLFMSGGTAKTTTKKTPTKTP